MHRQGRGLSEQVDPEEPCALEFDAGRRPGVLASPGLGGGKEGVCAERRQDRLRPTLPPARLARGGQLPRAAGAMTSALRPRWPEAGGGAGAVRALGVLGKGSAEGPDRTAGAARLFW